MTVNANTEAERTSPSRPTAAMGGATGRDALKERPAANDPDAEALLRRYLSEIHSYRQLGNAALRELEQRLTVLASVPQSEMADAPDRRPAPSILMQSSVEQPLQPGEKNSGLNDRLRELSAYLHADLSKQQSAPRPAPPPARQGAPAPTGLVSPPAEPRPAAHKHTPNAPVLDRMWFEGRFAAMRSAIDKLAEQIPTARLDALESQFHALMERLEARDTNRAMAPVEAGLKKLAAYLEDNRHWTASQDSRMQGVEDRLDQLSGLVAQSHAAISATAKGLEIVARGTGSALARATADLVAETLEQKLDKKLQGLDAKGPIGELSREVASLSERSSQHARNTDDRIRQLQTCLDESIDQLNEELRDTKLSAAEPPFDAETYEDEDDRDHRGRPISAAQRAARLGQGPQRGLPEQGEPVRYQIPYGEFLPDEDRSNSRTGLIVAAVILLLASAAMLYLNIRDRGAAPQKPKPELSSVTPAPASALPVATTASLPPLKTAEPNPQLLSKAKLADEVWVTSVIAEETTPRAKAAVLHQPSTVATESVRKAAVEGDLNAQFSIGQNYLEGKGEEAELPVDERLSKAARWFRRAAEAGHAPSQYRLATLYETGQGAPKSTAEAIAWYERAAKGGNIKAMHNLAVLSVTSKSGSVNYLTAAKWFSKAAAHGLRDSQYNLAVLYERGFGVERSQAKAYQWYALAAKQGDANAAKRREALRPLLLASDRSAADRHVGLWAAKTADAAANRAAPEPPAEEAPRPVQAALPAKMPSAQLMNASWGTQIAPRNSGLVAEAQRLLIDLGYRPGPADGVLGPRTLAAIREFEKRMGLRSTGQVTESLIAKMAFAAR